MTSKFNYTLRNNGSKHKIIPSHNHMLDQDLAYGEKFVISKVFKYGTQHISAMFFRQTLPDSNW